MFPNVLNLIFSLILLFFSVVTAHDVPGSPIVVQFAICPARSFFLCCDAVDPTIGVAARCTSTMPLLPASLYCNCDCVIRFDHADW